MTDCNCGSCYICEAMSSGLTKEEAINSLHEKERDLLNKKGFYIHYVHGDPNVALGLNAHTHGLEQLDHFDFQVVFPIDQRINYNILCNLAERVLEGDKFYDGDRVENIIVGYAVKLIQATENNREVLRVILPDEHGHLDQEDLSEPYSLQYA